ncbi:MAG: PilN domain-containing protein [Hydrogenothermaceae bacterium]
MIKINLNPKREKKKLPSFKKPTIGFPDISLKNEKTIFITVPAVVLGGTLLYYLYLSSKVSSLSEEKEKLSAEISKYNNVKVKIDRLKKEIAENEKISEKLDMKIKTYEYLASSQSLAKELLRYSLEPIPDGVWLDNITISSEKGNIVGYAFDPQYISKYYTDLAKHYEINFTNSESKVSPTNLRYYTFNFEIKNFKLEKKEGKM